jgi:hypothetical protein
LLPDGETASKSREHEDGQMSTEGNEAINPETGRGVCREDLDDSCLSQTVATKANLNRTARRLAQMYDDYRTISLNQKYYGHRLQNYRLANKIVEIIIASGATGSGIAGFAVWKQSVGGAIVWGLLSFCSILLAIAKPVVNWSKEIERFAKLYGEFTSVKSKMKKIVDDIRINQEVTDEQIKGFDALQVRINELWELDDPRPKAGLIRRLEQEINREIDAHDLWMPDRRNGPNSDRIDGKHERI